MAEKEDDDDDNNNIATPASSFDRLVRSLSRFYALSTDGHKFVESILRKIVLERGKYWATMVANGIKHRQNSHLIIHYPTSEGVSAVSE